MIRKPIPARWSLALGVLSVLVLLAVYTGLSLWQHHRNPEDTTIPTWSQLAVGVKQILEPSARDGQRWLVADGKATLIRLFLGLLCGIAGGIVLGLLMGCYPIIEALLVPPLSLLAKEPPTAMLAVFFVLVGTDTEMYVAMIAFGILPTLSQTVYLGVRDVPAELLDKASTLGASQIEIIWSIIARAIFPKIIDVVRLSIGPAMVYLIAAEMVCGDVGFGYRIRLQSRLLNMNVVYPYLAVLAAFGFTLDSALRLLQRYCCPWYVSGEK